MFNSSISIFIITCPYLFCLNYYNLSKKYFLSRSKENYLAQILKISVPISITSYLRSILSTLKQILIPLRLEKSGISCETSLSQYGLINGMAMPVLLFPNVIISSFSGLLLPEFSDYNYKKSYNSINLIISKIFKLTFIFAIGFFSFFLFYSKDLTNLIFTENEISFYLQVLSPLVVPMYLDSVIDNILKGLDEQINVMKCNILDLFISIIGIFFLIPILGIKGYLLVTYISTLLNFSISTIQLKQVTHFKFDFINWILKPIIISIIIYMLLSMLVHNILIKLIAFLVVYFVYSYFNFKLYKIFN